MDKQPPSDNQGGIEGIAAVSQESLSIVVAGGGTAGHIEPAMAVADAIRRQEPSARVTALGTKKGLEGTLVPERGYDLRLIDPVPIPRQLSSSLFSVPARIRRAVTQAKDILRDVDADVLIGFGGYVSAPAYLAARSLRIPFFVHEANARAGMANKLGVRLGGRGLAAVDQSGISADVVGIPVRKEISSLDRHGLRAEAREFFGLDPHAPVLLVTGGSQGARSLNTAVSGASRELGAAGVSVLHAYGKKNSVEVCHVDGTPPYVAVPYISRMDLALSAADMIDCRSGAMTVAEVSAAGIPAVYVPLPHGNGEQALNAKTVVDNSGAILINDDSLRSHTIVDKVIPMITNADVLAVMRENTLKSGHANAADDIAQRVIHAAR